MKITKAVVAAGGWSTRFLPTVKAYAKHLVPVLDKPQIQLVLEELIGAGIKEIAIVHRHGENTIRRYFKPDLELETYLKQAGKESCLDSLKTLLQQIKVLKFIPQPRSLPYGNGSPVLAAKNFVKNEPFLMLWGDDLTIEDTPGNFIKYLISVYDKYQPDSILSVQKMTPEGVSRCAAVKYKNNSTIPFQIESLIEKPPIDNIPSLLGKTSRFILTSKIFDALKKQALDRGELWLTNAENSLAKDGVVLAIEQKDSYYMTTGDPLNWLKTNIIFAKKHPLYKDSLESFLRNLR